MGHVLFVSDDTGAMVQLADELERAALTVVWRPPREADPARQSRVPDVVVLDAEAHGASVVDAARLWRALDPAPALVVWGESPGAEQAAARLGVPCLGKRTDGAALGAKLKRAAETRFVGALSRGAALHALGLSPAAEPDHDLRQVLSGARGVDLGLVRDALRVHAASYVAIVGDVERLRSLRVLTIPETNLLLAIDGARSLRTVAESAVMEPTAALKFLWALASLGVAHISPEPLGDPRYPSARLVARVRRRLLARKSVVAKARTHFDILELPPDFEHAPALADHALRGIAVWYAPERLSALDLADLAGAAAEYWQQALKAHQTVVDPTTCRRYFYWLAERGIDLQGEQRDLRHRTATADEALAAGQQALAGGDAFRAVSVLAQAARVMPDEPDPEAYLSWARYLAEHARGGDARPTLDREMKRVDALLQGRRPRGRALHVLGLMAQVATDLDLARLHLGDALACEPGLVAAQRALARLAYGGR